ncbi:MAG: GDSL-type esterase/lipase family protein [Candidatus Latescibacterota bacterium]
MLKKLLVPVSLAVLTLFPAVSTAQNNITAFSTYWKQRVDLFRQLPNPKGEICFLGDSITDGCEWAELTGNKKCTNRGISSDTAWGVLNRIGEVTEGKPAKVFLMIGTNDLSRDKNHFEVRDKIGEIIDAIRLQSPKTKIYIQSVLPVIDGRVPRYENRNIDALNQELEKLAAEKKVVFINLNPLFKDSNGQLKKEFTEDGLHLKGAAYRLWLEQIKPYLK